MLRIKYEDQKSTFTFRMILEQYIHNYKTPVKITRN